VANLRTAFLGLIRERRAALERQAKPSSTIIEEITPPERLWSYVDYVGMFLLENGVITREDLDLAWGLVEDYEDVLGSLFPGL
jgi:hypothetical protein